MTSQTLPDSSPSDLSKIVGDSGEIEYEQLLTTIEETLGFFSLSIVGSDLTRSDRDDLIRRLQHDIDPTPLIIIRLTRESWNALELIRENAQELNNRAVIIITGIEETPGFPPAGGEENRRPPALAVLNQGREAIRKYCPHPLIIWCETWSFRAIREQAPDFFDHFTGLFHFHSISRRAVDENRPMRNISVKASELSDRSANGSSVMVLFYEAMLIHYPKESPERVRALLGLAESLHNLNDSGLASRLVRAEGLIREAITILGDGKSKPFIWARAQNTLGCILKDRPNGDLIENRRNAIVCFEEALKYYRASTNPAEYATILNNLGDVYLSLTTGDQIDNKAKALDCFEKALSLLNEKEYPKLWASTQSKLGSAFSLMSSGDRDYNLRRSISHYESALRIMTERDYPISWARIQNYLGICYAVLPTGNRDENLLRAISCYEAALRVQNESSTPFDWASTQVNMGNSFSELSSGDPYENVSRAICCYESALRVYILADFLHEWARTQYNLALAHRKHPSEDRNDRLIQAITLLIEVLKIWTKDYSPNLWAMTQNSLGACHAELQSGDRVENLIRAVEHFEGALNVFTNFTYSYDYVATQFNLGRALIELSSLIDDPVMKSRGESAIRSSQEAHQKWGSDYKTEFDDSILNEVGSSSV